MFPPDAPFFLEECERSPAVRVREQEDEHRNE